MTRFHDYWGQERASEPLEPSFQIHCGGLGVIPTPLCQRYFSSNLLCSPQSSTALARLCPGVSGSCPRWQSGRAGGSEMITPSQHSPHSKTTAHIQQWGRCDSGDPHTVNRLEGYLLTEKREGKPWKCASGELPWDNRSNQKLKPRNRTVENSKLKLRKQRRF